MTSYVSSWLFGDPSSSATAPSPSTAVSPNALGLNGDTHNKEQTPDEVLDALLEQYKTSALPPNSRFYGDVDPQREGKAPGVLDLWKHAWFLATKSSSSLFLLV